MTLSFYEKAAKGLRLNNARGRTSLPTATKKRAASRDYEAHYSMICRQRGRNRPIATCAEQNGDRVRNA
jgi:hypothetical protein